MRAAATRLVCGDDLSLSLCVYVCMCVCVLCVVLLCVVLRVHEHASHGSHVFVTCESVACVCSAEPARLRTRGVTKTPRMNVRYHDHKAVGFFPSLVQLYFNLYLVELCDM